MTTPYFDPWWRDPMFEGWRGEMEESFSLRMALRNHQRGLPSVTSGAFRGVGPTHGAIDAAMRKLGGVVLHEDGRDLTIQYLLPSGLVSVEFMGRCRHSSIMYVVWSDDLLRGMKSLRRRYRNPPRRGSMEVLVRGEGGRLTSKPLGIPSCPVERGNYPEDVLAQYDKACVELASSAPVGRLLLIAGEPGTGKTYLLRGIVSSVKAGAVVVVQPEDLASVSSPGLLSSMMELREERSKDGPLVMLCEDADVLLVKRKMDNMSCITALLNLCDGMIGEAIDIRVVATTNAKDIEIDAALRRPGRMIGYMKTRQLSAEQSLSVFRRLAPKPPTDLLVKASTLAEVYVLARDHGYAPPSAAVEDDAGEEAIGRRSRKRRWRH
jgi:hypothetical protein